MRLIVARHGTAFAEGEEKRYLGVKEDPPLSDEGRKQTRALAHALRRAKPDVIFSGPQRRQQETAAILADTLGVARRATSPWLSEIDYGPWEGLTKEEILARWPEESKAWKKLGIWPAGIFGGTFETAQAKMRDWLAHLPADGTVVAVTSQGTLRALFAHVDPAAWKDLCEKGRATFANVDNGGWCELDVSPSGARIVRWNRAPSFVDRLSFLG